MGRVQAKKKKRGENTKTRKSVIAKKKRTKDQDQVHEDLHNKEKFQNMALDEDLPGAGQFYCIACARYFTDQKNLDAHFRSKQHRKMLKLALEEPHTQAAAEAAVGRGAPERGGAGAMK